MSNGTRFQYGGPSTAKGSAVHQGDKRVGYSGAVPHRQRRTAAIHYEMFAAGLTTPHNLGREMASTATLQLLQYTGCQVAATHQQDIGCVGPCIVCCAAPHPHPPPRKGGSMSSSIHTARQRHGSTPGRALRLVTARARRSDTMTPSASCVAAGLHDTAHIQRHHRLPHCNAPPLEVLTSRCTSTPTTQQQHTARMIIINSLVTHSSYYNTAKINIPAGSRAPPTPSSHRCCPAGAPMFQSCQGIPASSFWCVRLLQCICRGQHTVPCAW
jgi:hypothetical protein